LAISRIVTTSILLMRSARHKESVTLDKTTKCLRGKQPATIQDIKVGDRVVVTLVDGPQGKVAKEVMLATGDKAGETAPAAEPHKH